MRLAFFSNFLNHHQLPLCLAFREVLGDDFVFIATSPIPQERIDMKYEDMNHEYDFVICSYDNESSYKRALDISFEYDVVIIGSAPLEFLEKRMQSGKIIFRYCERSLKKGVWRRFIPTTYRKIYNQYIKYKNDNFYVLAASAFASYDLSLCGFPVEKCFKWGYFPALKIYDKIDDLIEKKRIINGNVIRLLWVGRLIPLKNSPTVIKLAKELKDNGYSFHLDIVGCGAQYQRLEHLIEKYALSTYVTLKGALSSEETRVLMEKADIFIFTSNQYEGWGAVINESMNSACAVVSSNVVGSAPYLIKDGITGLLYEFNNLKSLYDNVATLMDDSAQRKILAKNAYNCIRSEWNAGVAVQRFLKLVRSLEVGGIVPFGIGLCSEAEIYIPGQKL